MMSEICPIVISSNRITLIFIIHFNFSLHIFYIFSTGLSLSSLVWSNCGTILAIATSEALTLINCLTWSVISELEIPITLSERHRKVNCFVEVEKPLTTYDVDVRIARELTK